MPLTNYLLKRKNLYSTQTILRARESAIQLPVMMTSWPDNSVRVIVNHWTWLAIPVMMTSLRVQSPDLQYH